MNDSTGAAGFASTTTTDSVAPSRPGPRTRLRAVQAEDHAAVQALFARHGWPLRSREGWDWALINNPARVSVGADAGWVLEHGDQVVGFLGNLPLRYRYNGLPVWGATCTSYLVDEAHRAHSTRLLRAFAAQPGAAFVFSATANPHSAPVYRAFRFVPSPQPRAQQRLRWWASKGTAAQHLVRHAGLGLVSPLARWAWAVSDHLHQRHDLRAAQALAPGLHLDRLLATDLSQARSSHWSGTWDRWCSTLNNRPGLWQDRSAATMAWRLSDPDLADDLALWALRDGDGRMLGMCLVRRLPAEGRSPPKAEVMDWAVLPAASSACTSLLMLNVRVWARNQGLAVIDAKRFTGEPAEQLENLHPQRQDLPADAVWLLPHHGRGLVELPTAPTWPLWNMTGCDSDDAFNTHRRHIRPVPQAWTSPTATPAAPDDQAVSAAASSLTSSAAVSTAEGSKRSMSTV